ncbi:MAG: NAD(P)-dependent oxidoreductase [Promethearchaeota archaeon]
MKAYVTACIDDESLEELKKIIEVTYEPWRIKKTLYFEVEELIERLEGHDIFITEADDLKKAEFFEKTNIKLVISCRGDPFNVNLEAATKNNIPVLNTPLRNVDAVAELTVGLMLVLARKLHEIDRVLHSKSFEIIEFEDYLDYLNQFIGFELKAKTIGIIGFGQIGTRVADRLKSFGVKFLIHDPYVPEEKIKNYGEKVELDHLMKESDIVTIHVMATDENDNLINEERINMMKKNAYLINTSKGSLVDYNALHEALKEKRIAGAALDVFPMEPVDEDNEFLELDNVIVTPHVGGNTSEIFARQGKMIVEDIKLWLNGEIPKHILNPEVFSKK